MLSAEHFTHVRVNSHKACKVGAASIPISEMKTMVFGEVKPFAEGEPGLEAKPVPPTTTISHMGS